HLDPPPFPTRRSSDLEASPAPSEAPVVERKASFEPRRSFDRRRTERHDEPVPSGPPIVALPGESISKYKGSIVETQPTAMSEAEIGRDTSELQSPCNL